METQPITKQTKKIMLAIIVGMMTIVLAILMSISFQFNLVQNLVMSWLLTTAFAMYAFFTVEPIIRVNPVRTIDRPVVQQVLVPVDREVIREIQVPMENRIIEVVDRPVVHETIREVPVEVIVRKNVIKYVERKHRKLNIPHFNFIGSVQTRTYHKRTCKFSKMLKKKYKLHSNTKAFFKKKHYHACKTCLKR